MGAHGFMYTLRTPPSVYGNSADSEAFTSYCFFSVSISPSAVSSRIRVAYTTLPDLDLAHMDSTAGALMSLVQLVPIRIHRDQFSLLPARSLK